MRRRLCVSLTALTVLGGVVAAAQMAPVEEKAAGGGANGKSVPALLQKLPSRKPHSAEELKKFVRDLSTNDATFQVIVRQGRLLTLKSDLVKRGKPNPLIAVGDPRVIDVEPVGLRHLRITGRSMGVTDLAFVTADGQNYNFEVEVVPDLSLLKARLKQAFPDADLELYHLRQHVIVGGQAQNSTQVGQILKMIRTYLSTIETPGTVQAKAQATDRRRVRELEPPRGKAGPAAKKPGAAEPPEAPAVVSPEGQKAELTTGRREPPQVINLIRVVADLDLLKARLMQAFPGAEIELSRLRQHIIVAGQARDARQVAQILNLIQTYLLTIEPNETQTGGELPAGGGYAQGQRPEAVSSVNLGGPAEHSGAGSKAQIINLLRVPGPQQVLLKVQVAELNRTALRQLGVNFLLQNTHSAIGQNIGGNITAGSSGMTSGGTGTGGSAGIDALRPLLGLTDPLTGGATAFGVFDRGKLNFFFTALRQNQVLKILAEPNLVAMNGQTADFLAGGEFPVPVPQAVGVGSTGIVTIRYKEFGVKLGFVPFILDDDRIRLAVQPEVSTIDFSLGTTIQGTSVPALNTRRTKTTVELREGQTLAISGILQVMMDGTTSRIPGLGDLPYIGSMFRNSSSQAQEKELIVLVTPFLVQPMEPDQVQSRPGDDVDDPTDIELYLLGRIERRACRSDFRATTAWDDPLDVEKRRKIEERYTIGPYGYTQ